MKLLCAILYRSPLDTTKQTGNLFLLDNGSYAIQKPNSKWVSIQPNGSEQERDAPAGIYEYFTLSDRVNVLIVVPDIITYTIDIWQQ